MSVLTEVCFCNKCQGRGYTTNDATRETSGADVVCDKCKGERVMLKTTTVIVTYEKLKTSWSSNT